MNMREGSIGKAEITNILAISLVCIGIFTFDSNSLYKEGNLAYIALPVSLLFAILLSFFQIKNRIKQVCWR